MLLMLKMNSRTKCLGGYQYFIPVEKAEYEEELLSADLRLHFDILQRLIKRNGSFTKYVGWLERKLSQARSWPS